MPSPAAIHAVDIQRLDIPLRQAFGISGGTQAAAANVLLTIQLADGTRGYGEAAPLPPYNGETQAMALDALRAAAKWLVGREAPEWRSIGEEFARHSAVGSARCALETALLDAIAKRDQVPLWRYFGGAGTELETDMTVTTGTVAEAAAAANAIRTRGIRIIKVKVGGVPPALDADRVAAIHTAAPEAPLILDANAGLTRASAADLVRLLKASRVVPALLEQWLPKEDWDGMRALGEESGWPVAADEAVTSVADVRQIAKTRAAQFVNIKLMKAGVAVGLDIAAAARAEGLGLMIGGNVESLLAMTMSAHFAAGLGGFRFVDLDTPLFCATNPFRGGYALEGGHISVAGLAAGHGTIPLTEK